MAEAAIGRVGLLPLKAVVCKVLSRSQLSLEPWPPCPFRHTPKSVRRLPLRDPRQWTYGRTLAVAGNLLPLAAPPPSLSSAARPASPSARPRASLHAAELCCCLSFTITVFSLGEPVLKSPARCAFSARLVLLCRHSERHCRAHTIILCSRFVFVDAPITFVTFRHSLRHEQSLGTLGRYPLLPILLSVVAPSVSSLAGRSS